ncbi:5'-methylthioadenosine/S-adenosylhomocysteine nucleosidase [Oenococcus oeni]|uniref:5'-methylthioadenosine/adenosylhomocysteine nucleosidase n=1 Tax=Oenococcus oeni TaxID=1247 RepID=UPI0002979A11|nr:5'-methylthioadenosine/adenosylhomocysteine nucleosidase [Oenococcus oeni]EKP89077.1 methylthioadenosine nucleosidase [Oenococcus oeni AWRIB202]OIK64629.1 5'-methylthioadenosine/S-adenosylhomocysteine nucleosidase [Oenococcus oeni]OIK74004.1 5'-methylthioadenosine/S-adenosylhomocysteine nucleosidase [Oenococcus oeni]OIK76813.1 5'-methylthioadenosine/S-adenosylhomocysteine nucleosidase [Oenococcus oeni]OIK78749.1 5'-methylthioadenosine/S-adenosylhomocysteine nucleosidase [Oenococcus oeni]
MKIGIITPMEQEKRQLLDALSNIQSKKIAGQNFSEGQIYGKDVILTESGIGKVQAAMAIGVLLDRYKPDLVVNTGSAGALAAGLHIGDQVIASKLAHHDVYNTKFEGSVGYVPEKPRFFESDPQLVKDFQEVNPEAKTGLIVTGDSFVMGDMKNTIIKNFPDGLAVEMEGAAVAQVAYDFQVPFVILRAISDAADDQAAISFDEFLVQAGERSAKLLLNFIQSI